MNAENNKPGIVYVKVGSNNVVYYVEAITEKYGAEKLLINKQMLKTGIDDIPNLFGLKNAITKKQTESEFLSDLLQIRKAYARSEYQNQSVNNSISPISEKVNNNHKKLLCLSAQQFFYPNISDKVFKSFGISMGFAICPFIPAA